MQTSQSHDSFWPNCLHFHDNENSSRRQSNQKKFIAIDVEGHLSLTDNKALRSSLKDVHRFVKTHPECTPEEVDLVTSYTNDIDKEQHSHNIVFRKIHSIDSFFLNFGKTDDTLIKKIEHRCLTHELSHFMQHKELMEVIDSIIRKKKELKTFEDKKKSPSRPVLMRELSNEIENQQQQLFKLEQALRKKEFRKHINALLKKIKVTEDDSPLIKEVKKQMAIEHKDLIEAVSFSQVQFNQEYSLKIFIEGANEYFVCDDYVNFSDKKTHNRKKNINVEISEDLSEREDASESEDVSDSLTKNLRHIEICHLRDNEFSVSKVFEEFKKKNNSLFRQIYYQRIVNEFNQHIEQNELKYKLNELMTIQADLKEEKKRRVILANSDNTNEQLSTLEANYLEKLNALKTDEYLTQIRGVLKEIHVFEKDSLPLKEAKKQFRHNNSCMIKILYALREVTFNDISEITVFDHEREMNIRGVQQKINTFRLSTNFSDRALQIGNKGYFSRSPEDFSVHRQIKEIFKQNQEDFTVKLSRKSKVVDQNLLLNPREKAI